MENNILKKGRNEWWENMKDESKVVLIVSKGHYEQRSYLTLEADLGVEDIEFLDRICNLNYDDKDCEQDIEILKILLHKFYFVYGLNNTSNIKKVYWCGISELKGSLRNGFFAEDVLETMSKLKQMKNDIDTANPY